MLTRTPSSFRKTLVRSSLLALVIGSSVACGGGSGAPPVTAQSDSTPEPAAADAKPAPVVPSGPQFAVQEKPTPEKVDITDPPEPPKPSGNPLVGAKLFVDDEGAAYSYAESFRVKDPDKAKLLDRIGQQPQAFWLGDWNADIFRTTQHFVNRAVKQGTVPVMLAYNIPHRDCGQHSKGGSAAKAEYQEWIRRVALGIGERAAVIVLEPDALGHIQECLTKPQIEERFALIKDAVRVLRQNPNTVVYIDAGHARWVKVPDMAERLKKAGIADAHGFALNVSNYVSSEENTEYGKKLSEAVGGAHFVIDTSRNGAGPAEKDAWCNPPGRKIGTAPTTETGEALVDAYLWLKRPGESDGTCNGGPEAGKFWLEKALELARQ